MHRFDTFDAVPFGQDVRQTPLYPHKLSGHIATHNRSCA